MKRNSMIRSSRVWKRTFALPRGSLCIKKRLTRRRVIEKENDETNNETIDGLYKR